MPNFKHVIELAYKQVLLRDVDPTGLAEKQQKLTSTAGYTEAAMREELLRSAEYAQRFPNGVVPPPGTMSPLRVEGNKFANSAGPTKLLGYIICCDDPLTPPDEALAKGWPLVDVSALDEMQAHLLNYTDIRLGPNIDRTVFDDGEGPAFDGYLLVGAKYDLNQWAPDFWQKVRGVLAAASQRGVYVGVSIIDSWILHHELSPWSAARNHQAFEGGSLAVVQAAPTPIHTAWIRKVVRETAEFPNVIYLDGNESFKGQPSHSWLHGIRDIARNEMAAMGVVPPRLFGSNSGRTDAVDYLVSHEDSVPAPDSLPILVTEYDTLPVNQVLVNAKRGWDLGSVSFCYWAGEHSLVDRAVVLDGLQDIVEGGGVSIPDSCPWLVKMGIKVHVMTNGAHQIVPVPVVGGFVVIDLTPRFSHNQNDPQGKPCNNEKNVVCGGRTCEDPRGGVWTKLSGSSVMKVQEHGFQVRLGPLAADPTTVRCEPWPDYKDGQEGKPVRVGPNCPRELTVTIGVKPSTSEA